MACSILMVLGTGVAFYSPLDTSAQISIPLDSNIVSSGVGNIEVPLGSDFGGVGIDQFQSVTANADCTAAGLATVQVRKSVLGGVNVGQTFDINVRENNGNTQSLVLTAGGTDSVCVAMGYTVQEAFGATVQSANCQRETVVAGQTYLCTLTNTGAQADFNVETPDRSSAIAALNAQRTTSTPGIEPGLTVGQQVDVGPTQGQANPTGRPINPPTGSCIDYKADTTDVRKPSSMKIIIYGKVNLDKVKDALFDLDTSIFHVAIASDLLNNDGVSASVSNPQFMGYIIVQDDKGLEQEIIKYNILDFRRECTYISLAEAAGPATNANVAPLGELGDPERANLQPSEIDELLVGGLQVTGGGPPSDPEAFNPPFSQCITPRPAADSNPARLGDNFAIYNIRGDIDRDAKAFDENNLLIQATVDLNQQDTDLAKLVNNNNPLIRIDLLTQEQKNRIEQIGFTLTDVWTDCKQIGLTTETVLNPFVNELNY
jgi:hypothetical protein